MATQAADEYNVDNKKSTAVEFNGNESRNLSRLPCDTSPQMYLKDRGKARAGRCGSSRIDAVIAIYSVRLAPQTKARPTGL